MLIGAGIGIPFQQNVLARLLGSAEFFAPLTHSAIPTRAASGTTATFTRATTSTWPNNDGYMVTGVAGEIGFVGARRVRNLVTTASEDFSSADWLKVNTTVVANQAVSPNGATTADLVYPTTTGTLRYFWRTITGTSVVGSTKLVQSIYAKAAGMSWIYLGLPGTGSVQGAWFNVSTGVVGTIKTGALNPTIEDVGDGWYRCSLGQVDAVDISWYPVYSVADADNSTTATTNGTDGIYFWGAQLEDVTAQTTQTAGEYVSVGVESAPYYHGSFVDGVKCFPTDLAGNPIPSTTLLGYQAQGARTNLCLQSNAFTTTWLTTGTPTPTQNVVGPDGATSAWTLTDADGVDASVYQGITLTAAAWTASVFVKKTTGPQTSYPVLVFYPSDGTQVQAATVDTTNGVVTDWTSFTASTMASGRSVRISSFNDDYWRVELTKTGTAATHYFQLIPAGTTAPTYAGPTISAAAQGSAVFYGAQVELGSFASSYIATTTVAVTRDPDILTYSSGDVPNLKTLMVGFDYPTIVDAATNYTVVSVDDGGLTTNSSTMRVAGDTLKLQTLTFSGSVLQSLQDHTNAINSASHKTALTWPANGIISVIDGGDAKTNASNAPPAGLTTLRIGLNSSGGQNLNGNIGPLYGWTRNLSQSELQAVTA